MSANRIVSFEEIGKKKEEYMCILCLKSGNYRDADVALLFSFSHEKGHVGLCANHAECLDPQTIKDLDALI